ncbi:VOC family protein [uncultured Algibacter sp.]|uniref:VOC family protein n=1 Tax=uncultured Algibacter sp. TaxID=298659 RepID=UPI00321683D4
MKKILLFSVFTALLFGCNMNANKEERIQKLEIELRKSSKKINELDKKIELKQTNKTITRENNMNLGAFSISLNVKDINVSKEFYKNLGFEQLGGDLAKNYLIMKNENSVIGLFQGMFEGNILTFNPGWDENGKDTDTFVDIRKIQQELKSNGINIGTEIEKNTSGPASFMATDPDGNVILIDQHR